MSNYYAKREAKVRIAHELMARGWKVYGYKEDQSDSMTDYYSPANWGGIAEKNGFILVVDNRYSSAGQDITRYNPNYIEMSMSDKNKIESLKNMTVEKGATAGEEANARKLIEKINNKYKNEGVSRYEVIGRIPAHLGNAKGSIWHIEKDGAIVDKGNGLTKFADVLEDYIFDLNKMEFKDRYTHYIDYSTNQRVKRELTEKEASAIKSFKTFINRIEKIVNSVNSCGDGTAETEKKAMEQQEENRLEKVIIEKKKTVVKMQEVDRKEELKENDVIFVTSFGYCKIKEVNKALNLYRVVKLGSASRGYKESQSLNGQCNLNKKSFDNSLNRGYLKVYNLVEVEEIEVVEKWVKVKPTKKSSSKQEIKEDKKTVEQVEKEEVKDVNNSNDIEFRINFNQEKNGIEVYFDSIPALEVRENLKANGFRWSKFNKCWYIKDSQEARDFLKSLGYQDGDETESQQIKIDNNNIDGVDLPIIDINDIETYTISEELSKRENSLSMFRTKNRNHEKEIQEILLSWNNEVVYALEGNKDELYQYKTYKKLQALKKKYYNIYVKMLTHRANNPAWFVTGRGGINVNRYNKKQSQYEKMIGESVKIQKDFESLVNSIKWNMKRNKNKIA